MAKRVPAAAIGRDLSVVVIPALPSGVGLVSGLDASSTVLSDSFETIVTEFSALSYASLVADRDGMLNTIANEWQQIKARLPR